MAYRSKDQDSRIMSIGHSDIKPDYRLPSRPHPKNDQHGLNLRQVHLRKCKELSEASKKSVTEVRTSSKREISI